MDLDKLYFIHVYPDDWKYRFKKWIFEKQIHDLSFYRLANHKREIIGDFSHTGDALRYSTSIRRTGT
jgi:hypothetical protein